MRERNYFQSLLRCLWSESVWETGAGASNHRVLKSESLNIRFWSKRDKEHNPSTANWGLCEASGGRQSEAEYSDTGPPALFHHRSDIKISGRGGTAYGGENLKNLYCKRRQTLAFLELLLEKSVWQILKIPLNFNGKNNVFLCFRQELRVTSTQSCLKHWIFYSQVCQVSLSSLSPPSSQSLLRRTDGALITLSCYPWDKTIGGALHQQNLRAGSAQREG